MQFINNFRGIAILLVMFVHAISAVRIGDSVLIGFLAELLQNSTVLFVLIAGYLFAFQADNFEYKKFLSNKFFGVVLPYLFISIPAILLYVLNLKVNHAWIDIDWLQQLSVIEKFAYFYITGAHLGPLWFVPMVIIFYLLSPLLVYLQRSRLLVIVFILSIVPAFIMGRPEFNDNVFISFCYFLPPYLLGMLIVKHDFIYNNISRFSLLILLSFIVSYFIFLQFIPEISSSVDLLLKLALAIIVFAFCKEYFSNKNKWLSMFARLSFFLFFIHGYFSGGIRMSYRILDIQYTGLIPSLLSFLIIVIMSIITFIIIKLIFKERSKLFVGI